MVERAQEAYIKSDHVCACEQDDPSLSVMTQKVGPQHISVRFWGEPTEDGEPLDYERMRRTDILLDGVPVEGVFEAILGEQGTIWRYRGIPSAAGTMRHLCVTCLERLRKAGVEDPEDRLTAGRSAGMCTEKLTGKVELRAKARETCEGCETGGDASHTYQQGVCTGGR